MSLYPSLNVVSAKSYPKKLTAKDKLEEIIRLEEELFQRKQKVLNAKVSTTVKGKPVISNELLEESNNTNLDNADNFSIDDAPTEVGNTGSQSNDFLSAHEETEYRSNVIEHLYPPEEDSANYQPTFSDSDGDSSMEMD
ncbi:hypothetical protein G6F46_001051 [Rhizopus delemar]|uniref:Uncharacterized protein n=3 Tax=Rhizopus TaxID=4842 RepID=I1C1X3_RHIO9|nr:hypothetical protein RO3G_07158 [Rhizopus delemar RA 99-880]KAG1056468.1 hypothetical protein G6F43_001639 [Rhizopus delemar]KAG1552249.1 hypothetical protein G6F51_001338 [Rhizopus arrhizus]KAG1463105.1 hypothetical protein G6F55_002591 [Rhizopus delemar]KAG1504838.1 hypothetical protein G6F54_000729 [Rhizopus delemar]|eukprot:EIE82453.1 hypothetical protein RO3G_07158 [Rhizopus delemar RA 99-880]